MQQSESAIFPTRIAYAGFWQRFGAMAIDTLLIVVAQSLLRRALGVADLLTQYVSTGHAARATIAGAALSEAVGWLYTALMVSGAQRATLGKMALGIEVTGVHGGSISFGKATARYFAQYLSFITLLAGYFMMLWDDKNQTLHDKIAGSLVIKKQPGYLINTNQ